MTEQLWWQAWALAIIAVACVLDGARTTAALVLVASIAIVVFGRFREKK